MSSTFQLPQKNRPPQAEAQIHPEASRSWQDPGPWSPGAARLVPTSNVLPSAQPFTSLMHQQYCDYHEEGHQFGWEYIILWKQKTKYQKLDEITREVLISSSRLCSIADNTNKVTQLCANKQTLLRYCPLFHIFHSISKFPFQDMRVCVICFSCISVTGDPKVVLSVKSPPTGQRYGEWSGSWQLYATKNGGETEFRKRRFIENMFQHHLFCISKDLSWKFFLSFHTPNWLPWFPPFCSWCWTHHSLNIFDPSPILSFIAGPVQP